MPDFLPERMNSGDPVAKVPADFYNKVDEVLSFLEVYNGYIEKTENFWRIVFDPDPGDGIIAGPKGLYHFKIRASDTNKIQVLGGSHRLIIGDDITRTPFSGDAGDAPTVNLFRTVTITENVYVYIELDDILNPNNLTVGTANDAAGYPVAAGDGVKLVLGYVTFDAVTSKITEIEQYWTGGDWEQTWAETDDASLEYNGNVMQVLDFAAASNTAIDDSFNDLILYKDSADGQMNYTNLGSLADSLEDYWSGIPPTSFMYWTNLQDTKPDVAFTASDAGYIPVVTNQGGDNWQLEITDLGAGAGGPFWVKGADEADNYGTAIGLDDSTIVIDLTNKALEDNGTECLTWDTTSVDVVAATVLKMLNTTKYTANDTGSAQCKGGINFQKQSGGTDGTRTIDLLADGTGLTLFTGALGAKSTSVEAILCFANGWGVYGKGSTYEGYLGSAWMGAGGYFTDNGTSVTELCNDEYGVDVTMGAINAAGGYYDNDIAGVDIANWFGGGILTGTSIQEVDGDDIQATDKVLVYRT